MLLQILIEQPLESKSLRVLMVNILSPVPDIALIRTALVRNDYARIAIKEKADRSEESQIRRKRSMTVEKAAGVQLEQLRANRSSDHYGIRCRDARRNVPRCRGGVQHHACKGVAGIAKQTCSERRVTTATDRE